MSPGLWGQLGLVMAGGAVGAGLRFLAGQALLRQLGGGFPWGTLAVNWIGALAGGYLLVRLQAHPEAAFWRPLLVVGLLGGLTTFSSLMVESLVLWRSGMPTQAPFYLALSLAGGLLLVVAGARLAAATLPG